MKPDWTVMIALVLLVGAATFIAIGRADIAQVMATSAVVSAVLSLKK